MALPQGPSRPLLTLRVSRKSRSGHLTIRPTLFALATLLACRGMSAPDPDPMQLHQYVEARASEEALIPAARRTLLGELAEAVRSSLAEGEVQLTFICTHNSRRSQMGQVWARIAAAHHGIEGVSTFSSGTEATAFNPRAVAALERTGLRVEADGSADNPRYSVTWSAGIEPLVCWSKTWQDDANPGQDFIAVMTCSDADEACPFVPGAAHRIALTYEDPKEFDGTDREARAYDERSEQIARELLYAFRLVRES